MSVLYQLQKSHFRHIYSINKLRNIVFNKNQRRALNILYFFYLRVFNNALLGKEEDSNLVLLHVLVTGKKNTSGQNLIMIYVFTRISYKNWA